MFATQKVVHFFDSNTVPPTVGGTGALSVFGCAFRPCFQVRHLGVGFHLLSLFRWVEKHHESLKNLLGVLSFASRCMIELVAIQSILS